MTNHFDNCFDDLFFEDASYDPPDISDTEIKVKAKNIALTEDHPLYPKDRQGLQYLPICSLRFINPVSSRREISEYKGDPKSDAGFHPARKIEDGPFKNEPNSRKTFQLSGVLTKPSAFVLWEIEAEKFSLEIPEDAIRFSESPH